MRSEDFAAEEGESLNGARGRISSVESSDMRKSESIVDVDFVSSGDVEVRTMDGKMGDWEFKRGDGELRKSNVEGIGGDGEFL